MDNQETEVVEDKKEVKESEGGKKERFTGWFIDAEKILAFFAVVICGYVALTIKNAEPFLTFVSRQPYINDMLHDHIFRDYLELVEVCAPKVVPFLLLAGIVLIVASFIMDYEKSEYGYVLRIAGMLMASLTGLGYIPVFIGFGFANLVMNVKAYIFLSMLLAGFLLAILSCIYYGKKKAGGTVQTIVLTCITAVCVLGCFVGAGAYLVKNLGADYKVCYDANQLLNEHPDDINQEIAYQIGNVVKGNATWHDGVMYYTTGKTIWKIDGSGMAEKLYSLPGDGKIHACGIYYYEEYLYVGCSGYSDEAPFSVLQVSVADGSVKEVCSPTSNRIFFGVVDGKLLYTQATEEEYVADIYCIDLGGTIDAGNAVLYDKGVNALTGLDSRIWVQKYLYTYLNYTYWWPGVDYQFLGENGYCLCDLINDPYEPRDFGGEYPYSYNGDCTLILDKTDVANEYLLEQVVDFNIFNDTIYYMQEGKTGYDIYSCDKGGGNQTLLASVPVAFEESDYGCSTNMLVGEGFIVCEVYARYLEGTYRYFVDIETGEVKEIL
ncbi:MAG: hypothetical protein IJ397_07480 [Lachnospiraceae bacterium]|nr:hypothetical protein [Lachnospiraceae bacterium]